MLDDGGKAALQKYLDLGGNFVAIHSASDALVNTTFFVNEVGECSGSNPCDWAYIHVGARFDYHPEIQNAVSVHQLACMKHNWTERRH